MTIPVDTLWGIRPHRAKALMLAQREVATFVCDAVNLAGTNERLDALLSRREDHQDHERG
jgi:hypothetical protein